MHATTMRRDAACRRQDAHVERLQELLPQLVLAPSFAAILVFVYGFILWTTYLSFTKSQDAADLPTGSARGTTSACGPSRTGGPRSRTSRSSACSISCICLGLGPRCSRSCSTRRSAAKACCAPIYLYPMAISFIVTGTAWKWILNPGIGIEQLMHDLGLDELPASTGSTTRDMAIYCVVIAAVWQSLGLRHGDVPGRPARRRQRDHQGGADRRRRPVQDLPAHHHPADAAGVPVAPSSCWPTWRSRAYDLVVALTDGGPGSATELPATFMYQYDLHAQRDGGGRRERGHHADDRRRDHRPLPLFRAAAGAEVAAMASTDRRRRHRQPRRRPVLLYASCCCSPCSTWLPLYVMLVTSLKAAGRDPQRQHAGPAAGTRRFARLGQGLERGLRSASSCTGIGRFFLNSITHGRAGRARSRPCIGALNGYVLTKWRFQGADLDLRADAVRLLHPVPDRADPDGPHAGLPRASPATHAGPRAGPRRLRPRASPRCSSATTTRPSRPSWSRRRTIDGAGFFQIFWRILLPISAPILVVTVIWQFTNIWNDFLFGASFAARWRSTDHRGAEQPRQHVDGREGIQCRHGRRR